MSHGPTRRALLAAAILAGLTGGLATAPARAGSYEDFFKAVERDDGRTVAAWLRRGFDPNSRGPRGDPALTLAFKEDALAVAEALWAHPALDLEAANASGETPLMLAALRGHVAWMKRLIERGARVHRDGWSPIHYAASAADIEPVALMLSAGAPPNAVAPNGNTPLMMAAGFGSIDGALLLLQRGADPKATSQRGASAADFARMADRDKLAAQLDAAARR